MSQNTVGYILFIFFIAFFPNKTKASSLMMSDTIKIDVGEEMGNMGDVICMDYTIENFTDIGSFQLELTYNPNVLSLQSSDLSSSCIPNFPSSNVSDGEPGLVRITWLNGEATTVADGCILITLCFELIGEPGDCAILGNDISFMEFNDFETIDIVPSVFLGPGFIKITSDDLTCRSGQCNPSFGNMDGSYYFWAVSGTPPYNYTINGGALMGPIDQFQEVIVENLGPGTYEIEITDDVGATCTRIITLFESSDYPFELTMDSILPTCFDRANGQASFIGNTGTPISVDVTTGDYNYEVEWSNGEYNSRLIDDLIAGVYNVTITDALGCRIIDNVDLTIDTLYVEAEIINQPSCDGSLDGAIKVTARGGTPGTGGTYDFEIDLVDPPMSFLNRDIEDVMMQTFTGLPNGTYEITATDYASIGCVSDPIYITLDGSGSITVDIEMDLDSCNGGESIVRFIPNPNVPYIPSLTDSNNNTIPTGNLPGIIQTISPLSPGCYEFVLEDFATGCMFDTTFCIPDIDPMIILINSDGPGCTGLNDGFINLSVSGGTPPYTFDWNIDNLGGPDRDNLGPGDYVCTVTDSFGCMEVLDTITFIEGDSIPLSVFIVQVPSCSGDDGIVGAEVAGSTNFTFQWSDGINNLGTGDTVGGLGDGTYFVTATDTDGCMATDSIFIAPPIMGLELDITQTGPSCLTSTDGTLSPVPVGGVPPFTYIWKDALGIDTLQEGQVFQGEVGQYLLCIEDGIGCKYDSLVTMEIPLSAIFIDILDSTMVSCYDQCDGTAQISAVDIDGNEGNYVYRVNGAIVGSAIGTITLTDLCPGENWVVASNATCLSDTIFFNIPNQSEVGADSSLTTITHPICQGESTGSIDVELTGVDVNDATLTWLGQGVSGTMLSDVPAGTYELEISYGAGCTVVETFELIDPDKLFLDIDPFGTFGVSCNDGNTGRISLIVFGGNPGDYIYDWSPNVSDSEVANMLGPGNYFVTVTDAGGCTKDTSVLLAAAPPVNAIIPSPAPPACYGETTCIMIDSVSGGVGNNYTFTINNGPRLQLDTCIELFSGTYLVNVFDSVGCSFDTVMTIMQPSEVTVVVGPDQSINLGQSSDPISAQPISSFPIDSFAWSPVANLDFQTLDQQVAIATPQATTTYTVTVTDSQGCTATDDVTIAVEFKRNVYRPNVFSPNGDEINDRFQLVTGFGVEEVLFLNIYDRWGNLVYNEANYMPNDVTHPGWDGTNNGTEYSPGVYVYHARVLFDDDQVIDYRGDVTLVR